jgi:hypothetical protein
MVRWFDDETDLRPSPRLVMQAPVSPSGRQAHVTERSMDVVKEQEIIRLWNRLRLLQREGRSTAAVLRQLEKALAEHERAA